ncbi:MAG: HPF/RaiA family ribosome-associated protein [Parcubacteria group bacterium]|nr:HPF/RaiA family ribosome-associated protein [Parcubacteria group bacterium]
MNINIISNNLELLETYKNTIEAKLRTLEKFTKQFGAKADLEITLSKITNRHGRGDIYSGQAKFQIPGKDIFCEEKGSSLDEVGDKLKDRLKRLIIENKETRQSQWRKFTKIFRKIE